MYAMLSTRLYNYLCAISKAQSKSNQYSINVLKVGSSHKNTSKCMAHEFFYEENHFLKFQEK